MDDVPAGTLIGFEIEAYAADWLIGHGEGEDEASAKTLRSVARLLAERTGLPFKAAPARRHRRPSRRIPQSTPGRPAWKICADTSMDPAFTPSEFSAGVEIVTPPLGPDAAGEALLAIWQAVLDDGRDGYALADGYETGCHVNVSVPGIGAKAAFGLHLLAPFRTGSARMRGFSDPLLDAIFIGLAYDAATAEDLEACVVGTLAELRGLYATNVLPLVDGFGYVEFRHLDTAIFPQNPATILDLGLKAARVLDKPDAAKLRVRTQAALRAIGAIRGADDGTLSNAIVDFQRGLSGNSRTEDAKYSTWTSMVECDVVQSASVLAVGIPALDRKFPIFRMIAEQAAAHDAAGPPVSRR